MTAGVAAVLARGGSSRGLLFAERDLGAVPRSDRPAVFAALLGSPDPSARQVDGVGGGNATTSKVAVVGAPTRADADVDYEFYQFLPRSGALDLNGTCGNMSTAAAQFAISSGLVAARSPRTVVRLHDLNTGQLIVVDVEVDDGQVVLVGTHRVAGVPGTGSPIRVRFPEAAGSTTGRLLPGGELTQVVDTTIGAVTVSVVDSVNPIVLVHADPLDGINFADAQLPAPLLELLAELRRWGAVECGFAPDLASADTASPMYPFVGLYWGPSPAGSGDIPAGSDIGVRVVSGGTPHAAVPLGAALASATFAALCQADPPAGDRQIRVAHPSGTLETVVEITSVGGSPVVSAGVTLTARPIMSGTVWLPEGAAAVRPL